MQVSMPREALGTVQKAVYADGPETASFELALMRYDSMTNLIEHERLQGQSFFCGTRILVSVLFFVESFSVLVS